LLALLATLFRAHRADLAGSAIDLPPSQRQELDFPAAGKARVLGGHADDAALRRLLVERCKE
jgi:hypothetical protein